MKKNFPKRDNDKPAFKSRTVKNEFGSKDSDDRKPRFKKDDENSSDDKKSKPRFDKSSFKKPFGDKKFTNKKDDKQSSDWKPRYPAKRENSSENNDRTERSGKPSFKKPFGDKKFADRKDDRKQNADWKPRFKSNDEKILSENNNTERFDKSSFRKPFGEKKFDNDERKGGDFKRKPFKKFDGAERFQKTYGGKVAPDKVSGEERKSFEKPDRENGFKKKRYEGKEDKGKPFDKKKRFEPREFSKRKDMEHSEFHDEHEPSENEPMPLNKYIAYSGECSRRDAVALVKQGKVRVNGELVLEPAHRIMLGDKVTLAGKKLSRQKNLVYLLLNKPKGFITTTDDPQKRKTVMELVASSGPERLFPVGRLDRNTTGLLLMTNDGPLAQKLSHPSYEIKKIYQVTLDKPLAKNDFELLLAGVKLEDGVTKVDSLSYLEEKNELGLEIHSGRNRIVRRIFEALGYDIEKLDRVMYAGLTKKNIPRGKWRMLTEREIVLLKHFNTPAKKKIKPV